MKQATRHPCNFNIRATVEQKEHSKRDIANCGTQCPPLNKPAAPRTYCGPFPFMEHHETIPTYLSHQPIPRETTTLSLEPSTIEDKRENRKSLRIRPSQILENAETVPLSPLNLSFKTEPAQRTPRMSLFNLFSRPKVEKQRGYAERGLERPSLPTKNASSSTPNLVVQVQPSSAAATTPDAPSLRTNATKSTSRLTFKEPPPRALHERKTGPFEPPPLFQAYPQATKDGVLEVSNMSAEAVLQKSKSKKATASQLRAIDDTFRDGSTEETLSFETRRGPKSTLKHVANGASVNVDLPRKIFVLVTSGYLLQYTETGPSDRLPERMLHLGKESAAFACDLLPGKHYVLQVSQAVDPQGVIIANSGSIFSKLGIRSATAKRMTSNFLLVMPSAGEMESWMSAIRQEIESLGGNKVVPEPVRPGTGDAAAKMTELKKTPSHSHRYQIKRNPSKVTGVTSPRQATSPKASPRTGPEKFSSDIGMIDGIEIEASKLDKESQEATARNRALSDVSSMTSSAAASLEQHQLNNIRSSGSISNRMSFTSQTPTVATTVGTSRTNSLVGSPPSPQNKAGSTESVRQNTLPFKTRYRPMIPYNGTRRLSTQPLPTPKEGQALPTINTSPIDTSHSVIVESPVTGSNPPLPLTTTPPKPLTTVHSDPNLKGSMSVKEKHDSKVPSPPPTPPSENERPTSLVGDLPSPSTWSTSRLNTRRTSLVQSPASQVISPQSDAAPTRRTSVIQSTTSPTSGFQEEPNRTLGTNKAKRISFSMPLKVNPSGQHAPTQPVRTRRASQIHDPDTAGETPVVHTLTATIDSSRRVSFTQMHSSTSLPSQRGVQRSPSPRLSLFPSPISLPAGILPEPPRRSSSATGLACQFPPPPQAQAQAQASSRTLRRPASMQVRSDHAPFLASVRNSTGPPDGRAAPIRGMKPSRSAGKVATLSQQSDSNAFRALKVEPPSLLEEADKATPLPPRSVSPMPSRPGSRSSVRKSIRTRSSLPELDLGIPVVGLGPPAPPPSAPLPLPPSASRPTSPTAMDSVNPGINIVAGLGIRVS